MVDYSKWKNIEISDDEDETHPNIDTPSLFRWRHQARVERMAEMEKEKEELKSKRQSSAARLIDVKEKLKNHDGEETALKKQLEAIELECKELDRQEEDYVKKEKKTPWNVDTISKPGFQKTVINKQEPRRVDEQLTEEEREERMKKFIKDNEKLCKQYGMMRKYDDSKRFLQDNLNLVCDETSNYLVIWAINLEMEGKSDLMAHVAHQCICMQYIMELAKQLDVDPRACVSSFFTKIQHCVPEYKEQFDKEIEAFRERVKKRAQEKIKEAMAEEEALEREERLGPGGLDPVEVFEELPDDLKKCFESRNIELLQKTISEMPVEDAKYFMKRCIDSGLWVPNSADLEIGDAGKVKNEDSSKSDAEKLNENATDSDKTKES